MKRSSFLLVIALSLTAELSAQAQPSPLITPKEAKALLEKDTTIVLLDVRTREEFSGGHIRGAVLLPYDEITAESAARFIPAKSTRVILYCRSGRRSALARKTLLSLGYTSVRDLGGIQSWPYEVVK